MYLGYQQAYKCMQLLWTGASAPLGKGFQNPCNYHPRESKFFSMLMSQTESYIRFRRAKSHLDQVDSIRWKPACTSPSYNSVADAKPVPFEVRVA